jgi:flagellar biosynthesis component FlhA
LDGAVKFILGDFKIRLFIIAVNIVSGILIDVLCRKEAIIDAVKTYISLSMSNALLTIFIPFFLMSMIANCIITPIAELNVED